MIVFVDVNDVCRAMIAAACLREQKGCETAHAGIYGMAGTLPARMTLQAAERQGVAMPDERSCILTEEMMEKADRVFGMTAAIAAHIREEYPDFADKVGVFDVDDPFGQGAKGYDACVREIRDRVGELL